jgi:hypothetical protein
MLVPPVILEMVSPLSPAWELERGASATQREKYGKHIQVLSLSKKGD